MKLFEPDYDRRIDIPGVPDPVRRPVDIDQSQTGFADLRTLRIYRFDSGSVIDGHAEEDEVFIVVLAGSINLTMSIQGSEGSPSLLTAANNCESCTCAAYLPPHGSYRLVPLGDADVAYVRATPVNGRPPRVFAATASVSSSGMTVLLDEATYARKLRLRLVHIDAAEGEGAFCLGGEREANCEALVHVRNISLGRGATVSTNDSAPLAVGSWDTLSVAPGEQPTLRVVAGQWLIFIARACQD